MKWHRQKAQPAPDAVGPIVIPGLGLVEEFDDGDYVSEPIPVAVLEGEFEFFIEGYNDDEYPEDYHAAIEAFLDLDRSALEDAARDVFAYYQDIRERVEAHDGYDDEDSVPEIAGPDEVLDHIEPGIEAIIARDTHGDREVCVAVTCTCDWERIHGLQIVFSRGRVVSRVGPFDGHMSNAAAHDRADLVGVVYYNSRKA
jgi:hypothetical protein